MLCGYLTILTLYISKWGENLEQRNNNEKTQPFRCRWMRERERAMMMMNEFYVHMTTFTNNWGKRVRLAVVMFNEKEKQVTSGIAMEAQSLVRCNELIK